MIAGFAQLLCADLLGEGLHTLFGLPVPGPVIGMLLLATALIARRRLGGAAAPADDSPLARAADALVGQMGLLFIPAGVGVVAIAPRLHGAWIALGVTLVASTLITLAVTGGVMHLLAPDEPRPLRAARGAGHE